MIEVHGDARALPLERAEQRTLVDARVLDHRARRVRARRDHDVIEPRRLVRAVGVLEPDAVVEPPMSL